MGYRRSKIIRRALIPVIVLSALLLPGATPAMARSASLTIHFTNNGEPLEDEHHAKFYIYEADKREQYLAWGHGSKSATVPEGVYDIVIKYRNDQIYREVVREKIELSGRVKERYDFQIPIAHLTIDVYAGGLPILPFSGSYALHRAGQRGKPVARKRPGETVTIEPGTYDIEVAYRDEESLKTRWVDGYHLEGVRYQMVEFAAAPARATLTLLDRNRPVPSSRGVWRVFPPGERGRPVAERRTGERLTIDAGEYDVGVFYRKRGSVLERWFQGMELRGDVRHEIEMTLPQAALQVNITHRGDPQPEARFAVYRAGERSAAILSGKSGQRVYVDPGNYDIRCYLRGELPGPIEKWLSNRELSNRAEIDVELEPLATDAAEPDASEPAQEPL